VAVQTLVRGLPCLYFKLYYSALCQPEHKLNVETGLVDKLRVNNKQIKSGSVMESHIEEIVEGCRRNERKWQKELYRLFNNCVLGISYRYVEVLSDIERIVNHSFIVLFRQLTELDSSSLNGGSVYKTIQLQIREIVISACIEHYLGKQAGQDEPNEDTEIWKDQHATEEWSYPTSHRLVIEAIRKLPAEQRIIYNLFVIEGMNLEWIANRLNVSTGHSRSLLVKARDQLRALLVFPQGSYQLHYSSGYK